MGTLWNELSSGTGRPTAMFTLKRRSWDEPICKAYFEILLEESDLVEKARFFVIIIQLEKVLDWGLSCHHHSPPTVGTLPSNESQTTFWRGTPPARLLSAAEFESGIWLQVIPAPSHGTQLDTVILTVAVALRIGATACEPHLCRCATDVNTPDLQKLGSRFNATDLLDLTN